MTSQNFSFRENVDYTQGDRGILVEWDALGKVQDFLAAGGCFITMRDHCFLLNEIANEYLRKIQKWDGRSPVRLDHKKLEKRFKPAPGDAPLRFGEPILPKDGE